jgi:hypothetical protein
MSENPRVFSYSHTVMTSSSIASGAAQTQNRLPAVVKSGSVEGR